VFILLSRGLFKILLCLRGVCDSVAGRSLAGMAKIARARGWFMIVLTRLNGQNFVVNAEKIRLVESTPDTVVCCETGERLMVKETLEEVVRRAIEYGRLLRRPVTE